MGYRKENFAEGEFYHIYSRGNSKQNIFFDNFDRDRFVKLLYLCNSEKSIDFREDIVRPKIDAWDFDRGERLVSIGAWVMMNNHFHLYLMINPNINSRKQNTRKTVFRKVKKENEISEFMRKLLTSYSKYINTKYSRTGGLFEGRFKDIHMANDNQAKYLFSYIHLNPVKLINKNWKEQGIGDWKKAKGFLEDYQWSSYLDYKKVVRPENKIINREDFPDYFRDIKDFDAEIKDWLKFQEP
ncbi:hypothetical protein A3A95_00535 [Candidatus Nomurabacteria bacterium RIFCSPLOWO2_01_FULL_39_18]|nr:MAG: hypothetical protein A3A95_00535 [Candidatus Nomurabacteria bacterium RIFCSPLOWO2_01_FULL_39_18]